MSDSSKVDFIALNVEISEHSFKTSIENNNSAACDEREIAIVKNARVIMQINLQDENFKETCFQEIKKLVLKEMDCVDDDDTEFYLMTKSSNPNDSRRIEDSNQLFDIIKTSTSNGHDELHLCSKVISEFVMVSGQEIDINDQLLNSDVANSANIDNKNIEFGKDILVMDAKNDAVESSDELKNESDTIPSIPFPFFLDDPIFQEYCFEQIKNRVLYEIGGDQNKDAEFNLMLKSSDANGNTKIENSKQLSELVKAAYLNGQNQFLLCSKVNSHINQVILELCKTQVASSNSDKDKSINDADKHEGDGVAAVQVDNISTQKNEQNDVDDHLPSTLSSDIQSTNQVVQDSMTDLVDSDKGEDGINSLDKLGRVDENGVTHIPAVCEEPERKKMNIDVDNNKSTIDYQKDFASLPVEMNEVKDVPKSSTLIDVNLKSFDQVSPKLPEQEESILNTANPYLTSSEFHSSSLAEQEEEKDLINQDFFEQQQQQESLSLVSKEAETWATKSLSQVDQLLDKPRDELYYAFSHAYDSDKKIKSEEWKIADQLLKLASADSQSASLMKLSQFQTDQMIVNKANDASSTLKTLSEILAHCPNIALFLPELLESICANLNKADLSNDQPKPTPSNSVNMIPADSKSASINTKNDTAFLTNSKFVDSNDDFFSDSFHSDHFDQYKSNNKNEEPNPYAEQLAILVDQCFDDLEKNLIVLTEVNGDVAEAIERLVD